MDPKTQALYIVEDKHKTTVFDLAYSYATTKYDIRYNEISHDFDISLKNKKDWHIINMNSLLIELIQSGIHITNNKLEILMKSTMIEKHNPVKEYFSSLPDWDGTDYISQLASYVPTYDDSAFVYHLKKWLVRTIKCALEPDYFNKQAFILCHKGQSSG